MPIAAESSVGPEVSAPAGGLPETSLCCYEIVNADPLRWGVRLYTVRRPGGEQSHANRGTAKQVIWAVRKKPRDLCQGYGFVVDVDVSQ
jgi:hypothetical protein